MGDGGNRRRELRLLQDHADVEITCDGDGKKVRYPQVLLAWHSDYFDDMFRKKPKEQWRVKWTSVALEASMWSIERKPHGPLPDAMASLGPLQIAQVATIMLHMDREELTEKLVEPFKNSLEAERIDKANSEDLEKIHDLMAEIYGVPEYDIHPLGRHLAEHLAAKDCISIIYDVGSLTWLEEPDTTLSGIQGAIRDLLLAMESHHAVKILEMEAKVREMEAKIREMEGLSDSE